MSLKKLILTSIATLVSFVSIAIAAPQTTQAASDDWSEPVVTLGTSLTTSQKQGTLNTLTASLNGADYSTITVDGATLVKYLNPSGATFTTNSGVWSSAMVQKTSAGSGINVKILDYNGQNNITTITADQYKNAAVTAGVTDANIYVTSATPIDGSGALAGVYAAFAQNGDTLNQHQVTAAQNEMSTLSSITEDNKDKNGYSDAQLNNAVAESKKEMAAKGSNVTNNQITTIVNNQIENNNLTNVITNNQKTEIINMLIKVRDSGALNSSSFKDQASKVANNIQNNAKDIFNKLDTEENRNLLQKIGAAIGNFFKNLFETVQSWF